MRADTAAYFICMNVYVSLKNNVDEGHVGVKLTLSFAFNLWSLITNADHAALLYLYWWVSHQLFSENTTRHATAVLRFLCFLLAVVGKTCCILRECAINLYFLEVFVALLNSTVKIVILWWNFLKVFDSCARIQSGAFIRGVLKQN